MQIRVASMAHSVPVRFGLFPDHLVHASPAVLATIDVFFCTMHVPVAGNIRPEFLIGEVTEGAHASIDPNLPESDVSEIPIHGYRSKRPEQADRRGKRVNNRPQERQQMILPMSAKMSFRDSCGPPTPRTRGNSFEGTVLSHAMGRQARSCPEPTSRQCRPPQRSTLRPQAA